jgi:hypothetical protein
MRWILVAAALALVGGAAFLYATREPDVPPVEPGRYELDRTAGKPTPPSGSDAVALDLRADGTYVLTLGAGPARATVEGRWERTGFGIRTRPAPPDGAGAPAADEASDAYRSIEGGLVLATPSGDVTFRRR